MTLLLAKEINNHVCCQKAAIFSSCEIFVIFFFLLTLVKWKSSEHSNRNKKVSESTSGSSEFALRSKEAWVSHLKGDAQVVLIASGLQVLIYNFCWKAQIRVKAVEQNLTSWNDAVSEKSSRKASWLQLSPAQIRRDKDKSKHWMLNCGVGTTLLAGLPQLCGGISAERSFQKAVAQLLSKQASN